MKKLLLLLFALPLFTFAVDTQIPSTIKAVTVYLSGAHITRTAECRLPSGTSEMVFTGLSTNIDESSIQISGLQSVSILSLSFDIDYLVKAVTTSESSALQLEIEGLQNQIALLKNKISGLEEEEQVIHTNRAVSSKLQSFDLEKIKAVSSYYRERITAIKDEIFKNNLEINSLGVTIRAVQKQMAEANNAPEKEQGEITIKFDAPITTTLELTLSYEVDNAGWIPNYEFKSKDINSPLTLAYKAHVYQKTGTNWDNVKVTLSTGNPTINVAKPNLGTKYLNFTNGYQNTSTNSIKKRKYMYNPTVKEVSGVVLDQSGAPLAGANVLVKGTTTGTTTDFDGHYSLKVQHGQELVISYIGFRSEVLPIYSSVMNIGLEEDASALEEVVVTGYGSKKRNFTTGSVSSVSTERLLQGRAAGVEIQGTSSIKGKSYISPSQLPLYVVDGVIVEGFVDGDLDMDEIQSVKVLKGSNANALYGYNGAKEIVVITTKKSTIQDDITNTKFVIKKPYSIVSDGDITAIEINTFTLNAKYEYLAVPIVNENVFLTTTFTDWEQYNLLPGEASVYFKGTYAGKTTIDPYTTKKEMTVSLGIDPNITVTRKQDRNFKSKSFTGSNRILDKTYDLEIKNNKAKTVNIRLMDRIPISQNKDIKVDDVVTNDAEYDKKTGLLTWKLHLAGNEGLTKRFSFQLRYPKYKRISL
ncbi:mucoidy inhibitor MuiA family protein [Aggregatimonas sangjinii]|uniref:Mucoidy inhibitor MuiA family protein n=2 Tax=Aggregatimonas sangjinii TaxID=2583587 RepID=A0A5B7SUR2_9FLAO|nr:mucoidy inhibitor MuiA family protein [Aggregatimonas sangjinii]